IPFYDQGTMQLYTSYVSIAGRNHVHDPNSSVAETNPVNTSPSTHTRVSSSRLSIDNIDSETTPPEPTVFLSSENPMTPWNSNGNGMSKAYDEITITATNTSDEYNTTIVINGIEYENGVKFDKLGTHNCMILYEDKYNYNINFKVFNFEILKDYNYSPINFEYSPKVKYNPQYDITIKYGFTDSEKELIKNRE